ncbi:MAG: hypothetical protein WBV82_19315 [Myxococcaceae bacterium]
MKCAQLSVLTLLIASAAVAAGDGDTDTVEATGEAAIVSGNVVKAREDARRVALRNAVEQVAGTLISADTLTANSQLISDRIYSNASGYVKSFKNVKCTDENGVSTCTLTAVVAKGGLDRDLQAVQALVRSVENRKLIILTQEQAIDPKGVVTSSGVMSKVLTDAFAADGWELIDPNFANNGKLRLATGVGLGTVEAKEIGQVSKADYILYGRVHFRYQDLGSGLVKGAKVFPLSGEYDFTVFETSSGVQLGTVSGKLISGARSGVISYEQTAFDISRIEGKSIVAEVRKVVYGKLGEARQNGTRLVMTVKGIDDFTEVEAFKQLLTDEVTGVREIRNDGFAEGSAQYIVVFAGGPNELAGGVSRASYKGRKLRVTGLKGNTLEVTVAK